MLQIQKPLYSKLWIVSIIAFVGLVGPALTCVLAAMPEPAQAVGRTLSNITTMQEMTGEICTNSQLGESNTLVDVRDDKTYTVSKMLDGSCWMTQNLAFDINNAKEEMSAENSDVQIDWSWSTAPVRYTTSLDWPRGDNVVAAYAVNPAMDSDAPGDGYGYRAEYGYYYTWCAVTAGCLTATGENPDKGLDAASSICPKGWRLPKGGLNNSPNSAADQSGNDFARVVGYGGALEDGQDLNNVLNVSKDGYTYTANGSSWPAAGVAFPGLGLRGAGTSAIYWSRTANSLSRGYYFNIYSNDSGYHLLVTDSYSRSSALPARCVAYPNNRGYSNIAVTVLPTITIDAVAGVDEEVDVGSVTNGTIKAWVLSSSNTHRVLLSASEDNPGDRTSLYRKIANDDTGYDVEGEHIPAVSGLEGVEPSTVRANTNAWGIDNSCHKNGVLLEYLPITTNVKEYCGSSIEEATLDSETGRRIHEFKVGISIAPSLPSGVYETNVVVTGVAN